MVLVGSIRIKIPWGIARWIWCILLFDLLLLLLLFKILFKGVGWKLQKQLSNLNPSKLLHRAIPMWYYMGSQYVQILFGIFFFFSSVSFTIDVVILKIKIDLFIFKLYLSFSYLIFSNGAIEILFLSKCQLYPFLIVRLIVVLPWLNWTELL